MIDTSSGNVMIQSHAAHDHGLSLWYLFGHADPFVQAIMALLAAASFWSWAVIFFKMKEFRRVSKNNEGFWQQDPHLIAQLVRYPFTGSDISNVCNKARLFKYMAGQEVSLLMEVMEEQLVIAQKSRYDFDYVGSPIGFRNVG